LPTLSHSTLYFFGYTRLTKTKLDKRLQTPEACLLANANRFEYCGESTRKLVIFLQRSEALSIKKRAFYSSNGHQPHCSTDISITTTRFAKRE